MKKCSFLFACMALSISSSFAAIGDSLFVECYDPSADMRVTFEDSNRYGCLDIYVTTAGEFRVHRSHWACLTDGDRIDVTVFKVAPNHGTGNVAPLLDAPVLDSAAFALPRSGMACRKFKILER